MATSSRFKKFVRTKARLRAAIAGPSGAGKTFTALRAAFALGQRVCMIATEPGAVEKYIGDSPDGIPWDLEGETLSDYSPTAYRDAIIAAGKEGYDVLIIDSLSHEWEGSGGALELVDRKAAQGRGNKFTEGWSAVTPMHRAMFEAIVRSPCHVIATVRTKSDYVLEMDERGKTKPVRVGTKPVQREGAEYEFDVFWRIDHTHTLVVEKTRCSAIDGMVSVKPSAATFEPLIRWLNEGAEPPEGYYTADEEDLRRSAEAREKAEKEAARAAKATAPKKSAKEVMAEKAKKTEPPKESASPAAAVMPQLPTPPAAGDSGFTPGLPEPDPNAPHPKFASASQRKQIEAYFELLGVPPDARAAALTKRGANSIRNLTWEAAEELAVKLYERALACGKKLADEPPKKEEANTEPPFDTTPIPY